MRAHVRAKPRYLEGTLVSSTLGTTALEITGKLKILFVQIQVQQMQTSLNVLVCRPDRKMQFVRFTSDKKCKFQRVLCPAPSHKLRWKAYRETADMIFLLISTTSSESNTQIYIWKRKLIHACVQLFKARAFMLGDFKGCALNKSVEWGSGCLEWNKLLELQSCRLINNFKIEGNTTTTSMLPSSLFSSKFYIRMNFYA